MTIFTAYTSRAEAGALLGDASLASETTGFRKAPSVDEGMQMVGGVTAGIQNDIPASAEVWVKFHLYQNSAITSTTRFLELYSGADPVLSFRPDGTVQYWDGSGWEALGTVGSEFSDSVRHRIDVVVKIHPTEGYVRLWTNKILTYDFTGDTTFNATSNIDTVNLKKMNTSTLTSRYASYSGVIIADEDTRPLEYVQLLPSGAGELTEWAGNASDVSGSTGFFDATLMTTDLADQKQTFALPNLPSEFNTGYTVEAVFATARTRRDPDAVADLRLMARSGTDEAFGDQVALTSIATPYTHQFTVDPATAEPWTIAGVNALEIGVQSRAGA